MGIRREHLHDGAFAEEGLPEIDVEVAVYEDLGSDGVGRGRWMLLPPLVRSTSVLGDSDPAGLCPRGFGRQGMAFRSQHVRRAIAQPIREFTGRHRRSQVKALHHVTAEPGQVAHTCV